MAIKREKGWKERKAETSRGEVSKIDENDGCHQCQRRMTTPIAFCVKYFFYSIVCFFSLLVLLVGRRKEQTSKKKEH
jgi:hypothetical protein